MNNNVKKVIKFFSITEYKNMEKYFRKMAAKGWMISEIGKMRLIFKKGESRDVDFCVVFHYERTPFDYPEDTPSREVELRSGWELCAKNNVYQIYCKDKGVEALPIHTSSREEYKSIKSVFMKTDFISIILLCVLLIPKILRIEYFSYEIILSNMRLFGYVFPYIVSLIILTTTVPSIIWFVVNRKNAIEGREMQFFSDRVLRIKNVLYISFLVLYLFFLVIALMGMTASYDLILIGFIPVFAALLVGWYARKRVRTVKRTRKQNIFFLTVATILVIIFSSSTVMWLTVSRSRSTDAALQEINSTYLELVDFNPELVAERNYGREENSFFVKSHIKYYETLGRRTEEDEIRFVSTTYFESRNKKISDYIFDGIIEEKEEFYNRYHADKGDAQIGFVDSLVKIDESIWNAERGYYLNGDKSEVVIQAGDSIYLLEGDVDFSNTKVIHICMDKLKIQL